MENSEPLHCIKTIANFPSIYRTEGRSPLEIMKQSGYSKLFSSVTTESIAEYLIHNPKLINDWIQYSEDIRHSPAWALEHNGNGSWTVSYWKEGKSIEKHNFDDRFFACAKMIKMTLEAIRKQ